MTVTWKIETQLIPRLFLKTRGYFLEQIISEGNKFICDTFNKVFEAYYKNGELKHKIIYEPDEFYLTIKVIDDTYRMIYIELPEPRKSDFSYNVYVKCYCIPYAIKCDCIEILDMYGVDTVKENDMGLIIWYKDGQHMMSNRHIPQGVNDREKLIAIMREYIFYS